MWKMLTCVWMLTIKNSFKLGKDEPSLFHSLFLLYTLFHTASIPSFLPSPPYPLAPFSRIRRHWEILLKSAWCNCFKWNIYMDDTAATWYHLRSHPVITTHIFPPLRAASFFLALSHYHVVSLHVGPLAHDLITKAPRGTAVFILSPKNWWKMLTRRVSAQHKSREVEVKMLSSDPFQTSSPFNYVIFLLAMENSSVAIETNRAQGLV